MAVTKILARGASPEAGIRYILNEKKTDGKEEPAEARKESE